MLDKVQSIEAVVAAFHHPDGDAEACEPLSEDDELSKDWWQLLLLPAMQTEEAHALRPRECMQVNDTQIDQHREHEGDGTSRDPGEEEPQLQRKRRPSKESTRKVKPLGSIRLWNVNRKLMRWQNGKLWNWFR